MIGLARPGQLATGPLSVLTIFGATTPVPAWETMFGWPAASHHAVPLDIRSASDRTIWAAKIDAAVQGADRAVLIVADGLGCLASAWWARLSPSDYVARIAGAVLFAPDGDAAMPAEAGLFASPRTRLPFPSLLFQPGAATPPMAGDEWGSRLIVSRRERRRGGGAVAWREAQRLFLRLTAGVVEQDVARAAALMR